MKATTTATETHAPASGGRLVAGVIAILVVVVGGVALGDDAPGQEAPKRILIPFDFQSKFDDGRYGRMVGDLIWKKLEREGGFTIPDSMSDVRDWSQRTKLSPGPETTLEQMQKIVRTDFGAELAIWGSVERVAGEAVDLYDLSVWVADFAVNPPKVIYETKARTNTVSDIPHVYVQAALDRLSERQAKKPREPDAETERRWREGKNLVRGDFEQGTPNPAGWDPLPEHVSLVTTRGDSASSNRVVHFTIPEDVAGTTGVLYYSDYFPVEEGATYRLSTRWRTTGCAVKIFVKCYDELPTKFTVQKGQFASSERREVYRSQQNLQGEAGQWNVHTEDFTPKHTQFTPRWGRVMLYGYWPAGTVDFDDVVVKQTIPPPAAADPKVRRPSSETKVRSDEIDNRPRRRK